MSSFSPRLPFPPCKVAFASVVVLCAAMLGCQPPTDSPAELEIKKNRVSASNYPLAYFAQQIGQPKIEVEFSAPTGSDPSFWQPGDDDIRQMQQSAVILLNGATYEKWLSTVTLPEQRVVETADGFKDRWITIEEAVTHTHGPGGEHSHAGIATHTWLDPQLAIEQLNATHLALGKGLEWGLDKEMETSYANVVNDLRALDARMSKELASLKGQTLLASHPVYQYLGRRLEVSLKSVVWEPDSTPDAAAREEFEAILKDHPATIMLWEGEPTPQTRQYLEGLGIQVVVYETCGNRPKSGDLISAMNANLDRLAAAITAE